MVLINQLTARLKAITCNLLVGAAFLIRSIDAKGGSARAGGGAGAPVCTDCLGNYTEEEMQVSIIILSLIMILFFAVCSCQMYQRVKWEVEGDRGKRPMPMAPYDRDLNIV